MDAFATVTKPTDRRAIGVKRVLEWKTGQAGYVVKPKARLVAKGYGQVKSANYLETFAPTPIMASIRMLADIVCEHNLDSVPP